MKAERLDRLAGNVQGFLETWLQASAIQQNAPQILRGVDTLQGSREVYNFLKDTKWAPKAL